MPWKVETVMSVRKELVTLALSEGVNISELCRRGGVSRKTGYKWLRRYRERGDQGLHDLSRRPHRSPNRTSDEMEQVVVDLRREHPTKGAHVLAQMLKNRGYDPVPSKSTITEVLRRHGLIDPAESAKRQPYKRFEHEEPNQLWQMDFKGHIAISSGGRCHPLTVLDDHSRFSLGVRACGDERSQTVQDQVTSIFRHYGMPDTMLVDNGSPWGSDLDHPFTPLTVWLIQLGVRVVHSRPYHPQTLGKLERFHRSLKAELLQGRTYTDLAHCQSSFDRWRDFYNLERPHHALGLDIPASRYSMSSRPFPESLPALQYDIDDQVRKVDVNGRISFRGRPFRVGKGFRGKHVVLRPTTTDGLWDVFFSLQPVANINLVTPDVE